jgi:hypothetical protein
MSEVRRFCEGPHFCNRILLLCRGVGWRSLSAYCSFTFYRIHLRYAGSAVEKSHRQELYVVDLVIIIKLLRAISFTTAKRL